MVCELTSVDDEVDDEGIGKGGEVDRIEITKGIFYCT